MKPNRGNVKQGFKAKQQFAYNMLTDRRNVFLTGDAGTGKSFVIQQFIKWCNKQNLEFIVTAPTGIAAINVDGVTIHRAFKAPIGPIIEPLKSISGILKTVDVIIVDEISMCRRDLFEFMAAQIIYVNKMRRSKGQKDIQFVVVGDFFQLPPVLVEAEKEVLDKHYGKDVGYAFAFQSPYWRACNFVNVVLDEVVRQADTEFIKNLNDARLGRYNCISYFSEKSCKNEIKQAILLCGTNKAVIERNNTELDKLTTKVVEYESLSVGEVNDSDKMAPDLIKLKLGARVMTLVNDFKERYQNGSFGTVIELSENYVIVIMDSGETVKIEPYTWSIKGYKLVKDKETGKEKLELTEIGSFTQIPLKLAYAITIHKSQGQTYDKVNLDPYCWDCGQLYVALSRCKTIENMHLTQLIKPRFLRASKEVINFYRSL